MAEKVAATGLENHGRRPLGDPDALLVVYAMDTLDAVAWGLSHPELVDSARVLYCVKGVADFSALIATEIIFTEAIYGRSDIALLERAARLVLTPASAGARAARMRASGVHS